MLEITFSRSSLLSEISVEASSSALASTSVFSEEASSISTFSSTEEATSTVASALLTSWSHPSGLSDTVLLSLTFFSSSSETFGVTGFSSTFCVLSLSSKNAAISLFLRKASINGFVAVWITP